MHNYREEGGIMAFASIIVSLIVLVSPLLDGEFYWLFMGLFV